MISDCVKCDNHKLHNGYNCGSMICGVFVRAKDYTLVTEKDYESIKNKKHLSEKGTWGEYFENVAKLVGYKSAFEAWREYLKLECPKQEDAFWYNATVDYVQEDYKRAGNLNEIRNGSNCTNCNNKGYIPSIVRGKRNNTFGYYPIRHMPCKCVHEFYVKDKNGNLLERFGTFIKKPANEIPKWFGGNI